MSRRRNTAPADKLLPIIGPIDSDIAAMVFVAMDELDATPGIIRVRICSPGGEVSAGIAIYDRLQLAKNVVITEAWGECSSIAALILQAGAERLISPNGRIMIHNAFAQVDGQMDAKDFKRSHKDLASLNHLYNTIIAQRSGIPVEQVAKWTKAETYFTAPEAMTGRLVDSVIGA